MLANVFFALQQQVPEGFVPVTGGPQIEQIPAAPLVIASYAFFLLLMVVYLWTIWRRIGKVETEMHALERRQGEKR
jgi:Heme exporter protein D (CcmD)